MNAVAIYYVNQHLSDLQEEARQARLAGPAQPSLVRRILAAVRSAVATSTASPTPAAA